MSGFRRIAMTDTLIAELQNGLAPPLLPISVDQFRQMQDSEILKEGDSVELLDGLLVRKDRGSRGENGLGHSPRHALLILRLLRLFRGIIESGTWHLRVQLPVVLNEISAPEPDLAVVRGTEEVYTAQHPGSADIALMIEVADSSLSFDRITKRRLYATAGIPEYWIINLPESQIEIHSSPDRSAGSFTTRQIYGTSQSISWNAIAPLSLVISVADLFR